MSRFLHLITSINRGGAENHLVQLIVKQLENGHEVGVIYLKGNGYWAKFLSNKGAYVHAVSLSNYFQIWKCINIKNIVDSFCPDILHLHLPPAEIYGTIAKKISRHKPKIIISKHNDESIGQNSFLDLLSQHLINQADGIIHISHAVQRYFNYKNNLKTIPQKVIHYGINPEEFDLSRKTETKNLRLKFKVHKNALVFCTISRLVPQKRLDTLLKAFSMYLIRTKKHCQLLIIGDGKLRNKLKAQAENLKISDHIIWLPFTDDIPELLSIIDVFVLTSEYEGLGLVLLEAMAAKKPVIASKVSAIPEIVSDGKSGHLFNFGDIDELSNLFRKMEEKKYRTKLGRQGNCIVRQNFSNSTMYNQTLIFYTQIFKEGIF